MTEPQPQPETLDLTVLDGITTYVERILCTDITRVFLMGRPLRPFGVAFATVQGDKPLPRPQVVAAPTAPGAGLRNTKKALRQLAKHTRATGTVLVYAQPVERRTGTINDDLVVVQMEHKEFGDQVWTAPLDAEGKIGEWSPRTMLDDAMHDIKKTAMLPGRWMH